MIHLDYKYYSLSRVFVGGGQATQDRVERLGGAVGHGEAERAFGEAGGHGGLH